MRGHNFGFFIALLIQTTLAAQPFREISLQSGLSKTYNNNGIAVADYDQDDDLDLLVVSRWDYKSKTPRTSQLFRNNNDGTFTDVTTSAGIYSAHDYNKINVPGAFAFGHQIAANWGDYDNDGFPDLFLTSALRYQLYHNNGNGTFTDVTVDAGIPTTTSCHSSEALWFDYNNDRLPDLFLTSIFQCGSELYHNNGNGTFTNVTSPTGMLGKGQSGWMAVPWDINEDGFQDLYIAIDFDAPNQLMINNAGKYFTDSAAAYDIKDTGKDAMGLALADYNNDGRSDLYITSINQSTLLNQSQPRKFINTGPMLDIDSTGWAWGCQFEDFDHDLDQDLIVVNGYTLREHNRFYENLLETGQEAFIDRADLYEMSQTSNSNCVTTFDFDNDGDIDIIISSTDEPVRFYENLLVDKNKTGTANWMKIGLEGTVSNRNAIGTIVTVKVGTELLTRHFHGATLMAQNLTPVHFGLKDHVTVDELTIRWPSGVSETYTNLAANQYLRFTENEGYKIITAKSQKIAGCTDPNSCRYNPNATTDDGSCTYLEAYEISGASTASVFGQESYSYGTSTTSTYQWTIQNGKILEGQGSQNVLVEWGIGQKGLISVIETAQCVSAEASKEVTLYRDSTETGLSVARLWNEALLAAIREDYARPTVHARNLFHSSVAMFDAWALHQTDATPYLAGQIRNNYNSELGSYNGEKTTKNIEKAISYAAYRLLTHRFKHSPHQSGTQQRFDDLMKILGYETSFTSMDYSSGDAAALGNFIGQSVIEYGLIDGSNEANQYANQYYAPINAPLIPILPGNPSITDPQHWQPLKLDVFIDQAGNPINGTVPAFLSPEWGNVAPFAMHKSTATTYTRDGDFWRVYHDPGPPPTHLESNATASDWDLYKWNFALVSIWSSHLNPNDGVTWDISPAARGNIHISSIPTVKEDFSTFYDLIAGGDIGKGRTQNPVTKQAYAPNYVKRGDYTRVLAEFWADGPQSETPPGHWFVLLNYISDHPLLERKFEGKGQELDPLEWDVKSYFILGGAMHDAAISAWSVKGWYDYIRPISAIRYLADNGQSTYPDLPNYHPEGMPLLDGYIELVGQNDPLAGDSSQHVGKIKLKAWKGHDPIENPETDQAGVDWILAENWWPYQRPTFVTPPFAGYVSGHSTYSRAAAEAITLLTGTPYFPGGMGEFVAKKNEFLVFEEGPSEDVVLQWATYQDASDQCSLSRIWGGIHPPADDLPGRLMGAEIGKEAFAYALNFFSGVAEITAFNDQRQVLYPNPSTDGIVHLTHVKPDQSFALTDLQGHMMSLKMMDYSPITQEATLDISQLKKGIYLLMSEEKTWKIIVE